MSEQLTQIRTQIAAPISGILVPLDQVPDPVFAKKMVGDGVSIDPLSHTLVAPCDGEVVLLHAAGHAVTIRHADGAEVLDLDDLGAETGAGHVRDPTLAAAAIGRLVDRDAAGRGLG